MYHPPILGGGRANGEWSIFLYGYPQQSYDTNGHHKQRQVIGLELPPTLATVCKLKLQLTYVLN